MKDWVNSIFPVAWLHIHIGFVETLLIMEVRMEQRVGELAESTTTWSDRVGSEQVAKGGG